MICLNVYPEDDYRVYEFEKVIDNDAMERLSNKITLNWKLFLPSSKATYGIIDVSNGLAQAKDISDTPYDDEDDDDDD